MDFECFQNFADVMFIEKLKASIEQFIECLKETKHQEYSNHTSISDVKSNQIATIKTTDPSITISLILEVNCRKKYFKKNIIQ